MYRKSWAFLAVFFFAAAVSYGAVLIDPVGDTTPSSYYTYDLVQVSTSTAGPELVVNMQFLSGPLYPAPILAPSSGSLQALYGYIDLDIDQNASTDFPSIVESYTGLPVNLGIEYFLSFFEEEYNPGYVGVYDSSSFVGFAPIIYSPLDVTIFVPLSFSAATMA